MALTPLDEMVTMITPNDSPIDAYTRFANTHKLDMDDQQTKTAIYELHKVMNMDERLRNLLLKHITEKK